MRFAFAIGCAALFAVVAVTAQNFQNFSGHWVAVEPHSVAGHELRITQDRDTLTIEQVSIDSRQTFDSFGRRVGQGAHAVERTEYRLDGHETLRTAIGSGEPQQVRSSARWDSNRLVLSDMYPQTRLRFQRTLALDKQGRLVFEMRRPPTGNEPVSASEGMLEPERIVYEKR